MLYLFVIMVLYNDYLVSIVDADGLVLLHRAISSYSKEYAPMHWQPFMS